MDSPTSSERVKSPENPDPTPVTHAIPPSHSTSIPKLPIFEIKKYPLLKDNSRPSQLHAIKLNQPPHDALQIQIIVAGQVYRLPR